jgi:hypothetical protein
MERKSLCGCVDQRADQLPLAFYIHLLLSTSPPGAYVSPSFAFLIPLKQKRKMPLDSQLRVLGLSHRSAPKRVQHVDWLSGGAETLPTRTFVIQS